MLKTKIDELAELAQKPILMTDAAAKLGIKLDTLDYIVHVLEKERVFSTTYPAVGSPKISLTKQMPPPEEDIPKKFDEKVSFLVHGLPVDVYIYRDIEKRPFYHSYHPKLGPYTEAFLEAIKPEIAKEVPFEAHYFLTPERVQAYLPEVQEKIKKKITPYFDEKELDIITGTLFISMYAMGDIELLMGDVDLEEVAVNNSTQPISVYHRKYGWMKTNLWIPDEESIANIASQIARRVGDQITIANPILDAFLTSGDRACATLYPASTKGNTITIRKFAKEPWTTVKFIKGHTISKEMAAFLWQAVHYEMNIMVTGGTASGKTSMLNTLTHLIPNFQRVITIEEVRELVLPEHLWNWIPLLTRTGVKESKITMADLLTTSLRLRPDRVILGEIRTRQEAEVLFDAMHTGHSVAATFHSDSAAQMLRRLLEPPFEIPATEVEAVQLIVVQHRDRRRNLRRTFEISEVVPGTSGKLTTNRLYMWRPRLDTFEKTNVPRRYIESINLYTGMTEREILSDLKEREKIMEWAFKNDYHDLKDVGEIMRMYYNLHDDLMKYVDSNKKMKK
jgi:flagellar protein FlaI